jgi:hypothetical protein
VYRRYQPGFGNRKEKICQNVFDVHDGANMRRTLGGFGMHRYLERTILRHTHSEDISGDSGDILSVFASDPMYS